MAEGVDVNENYPGTLSKKQKMLKTLNRSGWIYGEKQSFPIRRCCLIFWVFPSSIFIWDFIVINWIKNEHFEDRLVKFSEDGGWGVAEYISVEVGTSRILFDYFCWWKFWFFSYIAGNVKIIQNFLQNRSGCDRLLGCIKMWTIKIFPCFVTFGVSYEAKLAFVAIFFEAIRVHSRKMPCTVLLLFTVP